MVKVGVIGAGFMGAMHSQCYSLMPGAKLVGIADIRKEKAAEVKKKSNAKFYDNAEELLKNPEVDMVDICLPTYLHPEWVIKAAAAGKSVICEKPIALKVQDADRMVEAADKHKVIFMVAQVIRFWPEYTRLKEIYDRKELGGLVSLHLTRLSPTPTWGWENWLGDARKSGSALVDLHIHDTDYLLYLCGKPKGLYSCGRKIDGGYCHILTSFNYPDFIVTAEGGWDFVDTFPFRMAFTANFEKGTVEYNSFAANPFAVYTEGKSEFPKLAGDAIQAEGGGNVSSLGGYYNETKYFVDCVEKGKRPTIVTPEAARDSLALVLKEYQSAASGKIINL
ncbi:MAG: Gfo/Idh/MocA family oxidoreductase [Candidatus Omnitrophota bacterium]